MMPWDYVFDGYDYVPSYEIEERKRKEMTTKINWKRKPSISPQLFFEDLSVNESFRNKNGRGAVYRKVMLPSTLECYMLEEETGMLWPATKSPVEKVDVEVNIDTSKPSIY